VRRRCLPELHTWNRTRKVVEMAPPNRGCEAHVLVAIEATTSRRIVPHRRPPLTRRLDTHAMLSPTWSPHGEGGGEEAWVPARLVSPPSPNTTGKAKTSISQRPTEVSPKPTEINFFVDFRLISMGLWPTEVFR
jgi:hypothetical protein